MMRNRRSSVLASGLMGVLLVACGPGGPVGDAAVSVGALSGADVERVELTIEGVGIDPAIVQDLYRSGDEWRAAIGGIPAGTDRTFTVRAYDAGDVEILIGQATNVTVLGDDTVSVAVLLQPSGGAPVLTENPPIIESVIIAPGILAPGQTASLSAVASDPDAGDTLTFAWNATEGSFADASASSTTFTAPLVEGVVTITLTVTDAMGAGRVVTFDVPVSAANSRGTARVTVSVNTWPIITRFAPVHGVVGHGASTPTVIEVSDPEGDAVSVSYVQDCTGGSVTTDGIFHAPMASDVGWASTGSLSSNRAVFSGATGAELLLDGTVLIPGGHTGGPASASVDRFDPITGSWSAAAPLPEARIAHGTSRLPDGRVMVVGGYGDGNCAASTRTSVLAYDPAADLWSNLAPLTEERSWGFGVAHLADGDILVFGGQRCAAPAGPLGTGERYDVATGSWSPVAATAARYHHTLTTLADGRVLLAGGSHTPTIAEIYDPATDTWAATGPLNVGRERHTATLLEDGRVLVVGGYGGVAGILASAEVYDPTTGSWSLVAPLAGSRWYHTATRLRDGRVLIAGGIGGGSSFRATDQVFDPSTNAWSPEQGMASSGRYSHTAVLLSDGRVLLAAGYSDTAEIYFPGSESECHITATATDARGGVGYATATVYVGSEISANHAPIIESSVASNWVAIAGDGISLSVIASDPDGDALSYEWTASAGMFDGSPPDGAASNHWTSDGDMALVTVRVTDARGAAVEHTFLVEAVRIGPPPTGKGI